MNKNQLEQKFSRHIGRILNKFDNNDIVHQVDELKDIKEFTKGEMWLLCQDLVIMLGMNDRNECNEKKQSNNL